MEPELCRAPDVGLKSRAVSQGNGELWRVPEECSGVVFPENVDMTT